MYDTLLHLFAQYAIKVGGLPDVAANDVKVKAILTVVFTITGALAVLFFVIGGMRYISSQGEPQEIAKAKSTLIYAIIGLLVSILAVSIVGFVLGKVG